MKQLPDKFIERYEMIVPDVAEFVESLSKWPRKSFRINPLKAPDGLEQDLKDWIDEKVPWFDLGFFTTKTRLGNTLEHFMGHIYIQEASSMLPPALLSPEPGDIVLDIAASPGSKTTQMAGMMGNSGMIIANDANYKRNKALVDNLERMGVTNTVVVNHDGRRLKKKLMMDFDKILVDAPCSGEGLLRKMGIKKFDWSLKRIFSLSRLQKSLILEGFDMLKPGGTLVYSTCTGAPEENEGVVDFLLNERANAEIVGADVPGSRPGLTEFGKTEFSKEVRKCIRIYPQDTGTELFFACLIRKK